MQDAEVASLQLAALATGETHLPAATIFVMGGVAERHRRDVKRFLKRLPAELPRTRGKAWRELRDLMERRRAEAEAERPPARTALRALPAATPRGRAGTGAASDGRARPGTSRRGSGADGAGAAAPVRPGGMTPASSPMTTRGCSVTMKCSWSVSRKCPMSAQMSGKSGSAMWAW